MIAADDVNYFLEAHMFILQHPLYTGQTGQYLTSIHYNNNKLISIKAILVCPFGPPILSRFLFVFTISYIEKLETIYQ